ncbi:MAG TPA: lysophospholipid acyltransferase family protein [Thermoflexales bacterium]|mgnify:FL=1|nr:1-acyl-sn-glycerol-3-phosphate acyltransferase [Anaerolineae bacterium]HQV26888.1 lysophospholipid acyltransferase family protein [Thermoflexales bacterium]HQX08891.1 lysophospholipid acyltransferase family protein [Thermoflexales bacterium]
MAVYDLIRFGTRVLMGAVARVTVEGAEHLARPGGYILASNHLSAWDPPFILSITPPRPKLTVLAAAKWQKVAPLRLIFDAMDAIYLRQGDADRAALKAALALLKAGGTIGMSPEGTRSRTGALIRARSGVAWLALRANTPVVPVAIWGVEKINRELRRLRRAQVHARVGPAISFAPDLSAEAATEQLMRAIAALLPEEYRGVYA